MTEETLKKMHDCLEEVKCLKASKYTVDRKGLDERGLNKPLSLRVIIDGYEVGYLPMYIKKEVLKLLQKMINAELEKKELEFASM